LKNQKRSNIQNFPVTYILNLETATKNCSVSISQNGKTILCKEMAEAGYSHAEKLHVFIEECLKESNVTFKELSAIAVSQGPDSGVATVKTAIAECLNANAGALASCDTLAKLTTASGYSALPTLANGTVTITASTAAIVVTGNASVGSCVVTWTPTVTSSSVTWAGVTSATDCGKAKTGI